MKLGDTLLKFIDNRGKTPPLADVGYELIETTSLAGKNKFPDYARVRKYVSEYTFSNWFRAGHPQKDDILIITVGEIGTVCVMKETRGCIAQNLVGLRANTQIADPHYLYYYLTWDKTKNALKNLNVGVAQPSLKVPHILDFDINIPPLPIQRYIADILSAYDDLIDNNMRRIRILEGMAHAIYEEWFGRVDKESLPKDWRLKPFSELVDIDPTTPVDKQIKKPFVGMNALSESSMIINLGLVEFRTGSSGAKFQNRDVLFPRITPSVENGKGAFVHFLKDGQVAIGSTEIIVFREKEINAEYIYFLSREYEFRGNAINSMVGASGRQRVQQKCFESFMVAKPPKKLLEEFANIVSPIFKITHTLALKNANLRQTRDLLLPRLVSGEVEVEGIEND